MTKDSFINFTKNSLQKNAVFHSFLKLKNLSNFSLKFVFFISVSFFFFLFNCKPNIKEKEKKTSSSEAPKLAPSDITLSKKNIDENKPVGTVVGDLTTVDKDSKTHTYDLDSDAFEIVGNQLKSAKVFDFENRSSYQFTISTKDSDGKVFLKQFTITINDIDERPPTDIAISVSAIDERKAIGSVVGSFTSTDPTTGDSHTYSLVAGSGSDNNNDFEIDGNSLKTKKVFDFETKTSYKIRVQTTDSTGGTFVKAFTITINDVDERVPTDIALSASAIDENEAIGSVVGSFTTTDPTANDTFTYSLVAGANDDDNSDFEINGDKLKTKKAFDFETKASFKIRVQTTDSTGGTFAKAFTITINDANESQSPPTDIALSATAIDENKAIGSIVGSFSTTDQTPGDTFTYSLVAGSGADNNGDFEIDGNKLKTKKVFDFETKASFKIRVQTTDSTSKTFQKAFTITINNLIELSYAYNSGATYVEAAANDGSIDSSKFITVTAQGVTFRGNNGDTLTLNTDYTVANVPAGLTMAITRLSATTASITFTGKATSHKDIPGLAKTDNVTNVGITFKSAAFTGSPDLSTALGKTKNDIAIEYTEVYPEFVYRFQNEKKVMIEVPKPVALHFIVLNVKNALWANNIIDGSNYLKSEFYEITGLPTGLQFVLEQVSSPTGKKDFGDNIKSFILRTTGNANPSDSSADSTIKITFKGKMLQNFDNMNDVDNKSVEFDVKFNAKGLYLYRLDVSTLARNIGQYYPLFREKTANDGAIETIGADKEKYFVNMVDLELTASVNDNDDFTLNTHYEVSKGSIPAGTTLKLIKKDTDEFYVSLTGKAANHASSDNTSFVIRFKQAMFKNSPDMSTVYGREIRFYVEFR